MTTEAIGATADEVVVVCGTKALNVMQAAGMAPKNRTVTSMREKLLRPNPDGGAFFVTFDPNIIQSDPAAGALIDWDLRLAIRQLRTGTTVPPLGTYRWVNNFQPVIDWVEQKFAETGKPVDVCTDTETETFFPWYPENDIVSISFTAQPNTAHVLYTGQRVQPPIDYDPAVPLFDQIKWLLTSPKVRLRLANGKYDLIWIAEKWGIECTNFAFDTLLAGSLVNENRSNGLSLHAKVYTEMGGYDAHFDATYDKSKMGYIPVANKRQGDDYLTYAGGDTDAGQRSADSIKAELLDDPKLARFYITILHPAARAFEKLERRGVYADKQGFTRLSEELAVEIKEAQNMALTLLPGRIKLHFADKINDAIAAGKNPLTPAILQEYFFGTRGLNLKPILTTPKTGAPTMAKHHLRMFNDVNADAKIMNAALEEMNGAMKTKSTFVDGFLTHLRPDGFFHPTYMLFHGGLNDDEADDAGSTTGRLSAKNPAIQIVPKKTKYAKRIRKNFIAPKGKVILQLDFSQGELRVVACIANERKMLAAYEAELDLHAVTGATLAGVDLDTFLSWHLEEEGTALWLEFERVRANAKPANFGLLYGMGVEGFMAYAWAVYGRKFTLEEATAIRDAFFRLYPGLLGYHDDMRSFVRRYSMVRSPLGRVRHLPTIKSWNREMVSRAERQAINAPVQATLTDMMIWAIALIEDAYPNDEIATFAMIHDAIYAYVDEDKVALRAHQAQEIMQNLPFDKLGWQPQLTFPADGEWGHNLADTHKIKKAA